MPTQSVWMVLLMTVMVVMSALSTAYTHDNNNHHHHQQPQHSKHLSSLRYHPLTTLITPMTTSRADEAAGCLSRCPPAISGGSYNNNKAQEIVLLEALGVVSMTIGLVVPAIFLPEPSVLVVVVVVVL